MARKLKVAHLVRQYHPSVGGLETYVAQLAQRQSARHRVYIITLNWVFGSKARLRSVERSGRAIIIRVPYLGVREFFIPLLSLRLLDRFDLKHAHATDQLLDLLCLAKRFRKLLYFATTHGLFFHTPRFKRIKKLYLRVVTRRSLSASGAVFAVSENDLAIVKNIGIDAILLRNPIVPLGDFIVDGADLIYVGRIAANKRIDRLIEFAARLTEQDPGITLHIVGADPDGLWGALAELVRASVAGDRIRYHGYLARDELQTLVRSCGYVVSASEYEAIRSLDRRRDVGRVAAGAARQRRVPRNASTFTQRSDLRLWPAARGRGSLLSLARNHHDGRPSEGRRVRACAELGRRGENR